MKSLLYDLIVGGAILMGLIAIVPIMEANQNYIRNSALTRSGNERLDVVYSESGFEKNQYDITDVYAFVLQNINEQGYISRNIKIDFIFTDEVAGTESRISFSSALSASELQSSVNFLRGYLNDTTTKYDIKLESTNDPAIGVVKTYTIENK